MKSIKLASIFFVVLSACATKQKILGPVAASMTHQNLKDGETLKDAGAVSATVCADSVFDRGPIGLLDEAIRAAQDQSDADFITNATFYETGNHCVLVEGQASKVVAASLAPPPPIEPPVRAKIKKR